MEKRKKILIADDMALFRNLEALFLARSGEILTARNGTEGLAIARCERPDLIIADLDMPDLNGDGLCRAVKGDPELRETPVVLVTSGERAEDHARAVRARADDVLAKPLNRIQLGLAATRLLRERPARGLTRVAPDTEVRVRLARADACSWGVLRDLSRGGIFVASNGTLPLDTEIELDFRLPGSRTPLQSTARVIWAGRHTASGNRGMGLRFLALDRASTHCIEGYVYERSELLPNAAPHA